MRRPLPTASALDTALACAGSSVLPGCDETGGYAPAGTVFHRYLDDARKMGKATALAAAPEDERDWLATLDLDALPAGAESEVALGWSPTEDRAVRYQLDDHRAYPADGLYHGTLDLVGAAAARVIVYDFKRYGAKVRAAESAQLGFGALASARLAGVDAAEVGMLAPGRNGWIVDRAQLDVLDLARWADRLAALAAQIAAYHEGDMPPLVVGEHCTYCKVLRWCPAQTAIVRQLTAMQPATIDALIAKLSDEEAGSLWERANLAEKIVEAAKGALKARAQQAPIPLANHKELRAVKWSHPVKSDVAKAELAALTVALKDRGEITSQPSVQVRAVKKGG